MMVEEEFSEQSLCLVLKFRILHVYLFYASIQLKISFKQMITDIKC